MKNGGMGRREIGCEKDFLLLMFVGKKEKKKFWRDGDGEEGEDGRAMEISSKQPSNNISRR